MTSTGRIKNLFNTTKIFFKENVRYPVWTCRDPISLILGTRFSLILGTRFLFLGTRIESLKHLKKPWILLLYVASWFTSLMLLNTPGGLALKWRGNVEVMTTFFQIFWQNPEILKSRVSVSVSDFKSRSRNFWWSLGLEGDGLDYLTATLFQDNSLNQTSFDKKFWILDTKATCTKWRWES